MVSGALSSAIFFSVELKDPRPINACVVLFSSDLPCIGTGSVCDAILLNSYVSPVLFYRDAKCQRLDISLESASSLWGSAQFWASTERSNGEIYAS